MAVVSMPASSTRHLKVTCEPAPLRLGTLRPKENLMKKSVKWLLAVTVAVVVLVVGGTWLYINVFTDDAPPEVTLDSVGGETGIEGGVVEDPPEGDLEGAWKPAADAVLGYRVEEVLFGQNKEAYGRTDKISGELTITGTQVTEVELTVDMASVRSDESRRDRQFNGRIMDTATYPAATFELTQPIELTTIPNDNREISAQATGDLTLRGVTRPVTFELKAQRDGARFKVNGTIPVTFSDYGIPNPSTPGISTEDHGVLEFAVLFEKSV